MDVDLFGSFMDVDLFGSCIGYVPILRSDTWMSNRSCIRLLKHSINCNAYFLCIVLLANSRLFCLSENKMKENLYILTQPIQVKYGQMPAETFVC